MVSSAFLSIILVIVFYKIFIQYSFNTNKKNFNKQTFIKKCIFHKSENFINEKIFSDIIHANILKQFLSINKLTDKSNTYHYIVSPGDLLNSVLMECSNGNIDSSIITCLVNQYPILKNLQWNQSLSWITENKNLKFLIWDMFPQEIRIYNRTNFGFTEGIIRRINLLNCEFLDTFLFIGELSETFINSVRLLGIEENCIIDIINAFRCQLDFKKLHKRDRFSILMSTVVSNNYDIKNQFIGARLHTSGRNYYVFRASNGRLYDNNAIRLENDFIRFPTLKPFRISSGFNLNRLNPVTRQMVPHSGVDFAVPVGTPVLSVGDGEVIISKYSKIAGNYIVIKHSKHYITRYMHLKKLLVKSGQKVQRGDKIALSGNTGRSTGPHLHFEMWINHRPVDPLTTKILNIEKLSGNERIMYVEKINEILPKLSLE